MERRREYSRRCCLRRQVFQEMTKFAIYPLQQMAMDDCDELLKDYFTNHDNTYEDAADRGADSDSDSSEPPKRMVQQQQQTHDVSPTSNKDESDALRQQFRQEFMKERSIIPIGGAVNINVVHGKDSGLPDGVVDKTDTNTHAPINNTLDEKENSEGSNNLQAPIETKEQAKSTSDGHMNKVEQYRQQFLPTLWSMEPRLFAMESAMKGKRRYISAQLGRFLDHYWRECDVYNRHYYELIRENSPCRLYFGK